MKPVRIQLRRAKGWRMPPNTVKVDRTTRFGNPFRVQRDRTATEAVDFHTYLLGGCICLCGDPSPKEQQGYLAMLNSERDKAWPALRGKNLACWCRLDKPCHADLLLKIAAVDAGGAARMISLSLLREARDVMQRADSETGCDCPSILVGGFHQTHCWKFDFLACLARLDAALAAESARQSGVEDLERRLSMLPREVQNSREAWREHAIVCHYLAVAAIAALKGVRP